MMKNKGQPKKNPNASEKQSAPYEVQLHTVHHVARTADQRGQSR